MRYLTHVPLFHSSGIGLMVSRARHGSAAVTPKESHLETFETTPPVRSAPARIQGINSFLPFVETGLGPLGGLFDLLSGRVL